MAERINCCPVCMCRHRVSLTASGSEYASLIIPAKGQVWPNVCLNCGTVYISRDVIEDISRKNNNKTVR
jgi:hypothetical protein